MSFMIMNAGVRLCHALEDSQKYPVLYCPDFHLSKRYFVMHDPVFLFLQLQSLELQ